MSICISFVISLGVLMAAFELLMFYFPSRQILEDGTEIANMALFQFSISAIIAIIFFVIFAKFTYYFLDSKIGVNLFKN